MFCVFVYLTVFITTDEIEKFETKEAEKIFKIYEKFSPEYQKAVSDFIQINFGYLMKLSEVIGESILLDLREKGKRR